MDRAPNAASIAFAMRRSAPDLKETWNDVSRPTAGISRDTPSIAGRRTIGGGWRAPRCATGALGRVSVPRLDPGADEVVPGQTGIYWGACPSHRRRRPTRAIR